MLLIPWQDRKNSNDSLISFSTKRDWKLSIFCLILRLSSHEDKKSRQDQKFVTRDWRNWKSGQAQQAMSTAIYDKKRIRKSRQDKIQATHALKSIKLANEKIRHIFGYSWVFGTLACAGMDYNQYFWFQSIMLPGWSLIIIISMVRRKIPRAWRD